MIRVQILWLVLDFMPTLSNQSAAAAELMTTQLFLELMDCDAVGNLKRFTQSKTIDSDLTQWAPGILKIEVYLPRLHQVIDILKTHLPASHPVTFYIDVQGTQKPIAVDLQQDTEAVTHSLLGTLGHQLGVDLLNQPMQ